MYLGEDPDELTDAALDRVIALFDAIRPYIRKFDNTGYKQAMAQGGNCAAVGWSEAIYLANELMQKTGSKISIQYIVPREGGLIGMSGLVIPKDAPHRENAEAFVNYAISSEAGAALTNAVKIASAVPASRALLPAEVLANPITFPDTGSNLHYFKGAVNEKDVRRLNRAWSRVKHGL
jgi:putrescine transport system substrate-binding protein